MCAKLHGCNILDVNRSAFNLFNDGILDVSFICYPADATDDVLSIVLLHDTATSRHIALSDSGKNFSEGDAIGAQVLRPNIDLIFERCSPHDSHVCDTLGRI